MTILPLYSTNEGSTPEGDAPNEFDCAIRLSASDDHTEYCLNVVNFREILNRSSYAIFDRAELKLLHDAIGAELKSTEN